MRAISVRELSVRNFRNLRAVDLAPSRQLTIILGDNGQGKTNLLEAIYLAATTKSFRGATTGDLLEHGAETSSVRAKVALEDESWTQSVGLRRGGRVPLLDSKRPPSLAFYATRTPVVLFHPESVQLSTGSSSERRRLLDRVAFFFNAAHLAAVRDYTHAARARQRLLETEGVRSSQLQDWEVLMAKSASVVQAGRSEAATRLRLRVRAEFAPLLPEALGFDASYAPSGPETEETFRDLLSANRSRDLQRKRATSGPQSDDLRLELQGRPMRTVASQGQHRAAVLALTLAELLTIAELRGATPAVLLDDFSSELDPDRTAILLTLLRSVAAQVFLTTASPAIAHLVAARYGEATSLHRMVAGNLEPP